MEVQQVIQAFPGQLRTSQQESGEIPQLPEVLWSLESRLDALEQRTNPPSAPSDDGGGTRVVEITQRKDNETNSPKRKRGRPPQRPILAHTKTDQGQMLDPSLFKEVGQRVSRGRLAI